MQSVVNFEHERAEDMCPTNVAVHFLHVRALENKYGIKEL